MSAKCSVTISLVPEARGGPFVFWDDLAEGMAQAARLGFDGVEIFPPGPEAIDIPTVKQQLTHHGLDLAAMGTGPGWIKHKLTLTHADANVRSRGVQFIKSIIAVAGQLGAPAIIGSMQGRWSDDVPKTQALAYLAEGLNELGTYAEQFNVPVLYEPLNRYETNLLTTIESSVAFLQTLRTTNVKLLADLFHMNIEEANLAAALQAGGQHIGHIHLADSNRRPAGGGHTDFAAIANAVRAMNYTGYLSAEAFPYPTPLEAAQATIATFQRYFRHSSPNA